MPRFLARLALLLCLLTTSLLATTYHANFTSSSTIPISQDGFTATNHDLNFTLNFTPTPGTSLTVIHNTGNQPIEGYFTNLAHGQIINIAYNQTIYRFIANYYGGNGNDLVLQWANQTACSWGLNNYGQLGDNSSSQRNSPVNVYTQGVLAGKSITQMSAGISHSLALCSDGTVAAWGLNQAGQLGIGNTTSLQTPQAVYFNPSVFSGKTITAIATGGQHSLALCSDGTVAAWGLNASGQLGIGNTTSQAIPVTVDASGVLKNRKVIAISAGSEHSLALCSDGQLVAWGQGTSGQLGNSTSTTSPYPVAVTQSGALANQTITQISAGGKHNLVTCSSGNVYSWGLNAAGQLGNQSTTYSNQPIRVSLGYLANQSVTQVSAGTDHSLALCSDGTIAAWGSNSYGLLGDQSSTTRTIPVKVLFQGSVANKLATYIAAGMAHSIARCSDGTVIAWGRNNFAQLANPTSTPYSLIPIPITLGALTNQFLVSADLGDHFSLSVAASAPIIPNTDSSLAALSIPNQTFSPAFTSGYTNYTATVPASTATLPLSWIPAHASSTIKVNGITATSTAAVPLNFGSNSISITVTSPSKATTTYSLQISRSLPSSISSLNQLSASPASLSPSFAANTLSYSASVPYSTSTLTISATPSDPNATLSLNDTPLTAGTPSAPQPLAVGINHFTILVTAEDGHSSTSYSLTLTRAPSPSSLLANLSSPSSPLYPSFRPRVTSYSFALPASQSTTRFTPTVTDSMTRVEVNGQRVPSGSLSQEIPLNPGVNSIPIRLIAQDGATLTYTVSVVRSSSISYSFASPSSVALTTPAFNATDLSASLSLNHLPTIGSTLTVIQNTGADRIHGEFTNLHHGQLIYLPYQGKLFAWIVNYYGGSGNDLTLEWANQSLASWGANSFGQLGNASTTHAFSPVPLPPSSLLNGKHILRARTGLAHSLVLCSDGSIATWGQGTLGQLGNGADLNASSPVAITPTPAIQGKTLIDVACSHHNLALCSDGTLVAWGYNYDRQLCNGSYANANSPSRVQPIRALTQQSIVAIAVGDSHSLALADNGALISWGSNAYGQLGIGRISLDEEPSFVLMSGALVDKSVIAIASGGNGNLALCSDGSLVSWGTYPGDGSTQSHTPVLVSTTGALAGKSVTAIARGANHSLVLCSDGSLITWGENSYGQLGSGNTTTSLTPITISPSWPNASIHSIHAGNGSSILQLLDGSLRVWGKNDQGELATGNASNLTTPTAVNHSQTLPNLTLTQLALTGNHTLTLTAAAMPNLTDYDLWLAQHPSTSNPSFDADPDNDGLSNLLEYIFDTNPNTPNPNSPLTLTTTDTLTQFSIKRRAYSSDLSNQSFQFSENLSSWTTLSLTPPTDPRIQISEPDADGFQTVTITLPNQNHRQFGRFLASPK